MNNYEEQANELLAKMAVKISVVFLENKKYFHSDTESRDVYKITFSRKKRSFSITFGQSLNESGFYYDFLNNGVSDIIHYPTEPTAYSVLACLTKYDPGSFENFCGEYGYSTDSRAAKKTHKAVVKEWNKVQAFFTDDEIDFLQEIN